MKAVALSLGGAILPLAHAALADTTAPASAPPSAKAVARRAPPAPPDGRADFVVSRITWALGPDATPHNCPNGMTSLGDFIYGGNNGGAGAVRRQDIANGNGTVTVNQGAVTQGQGAANQGPGNQGNNAGARPPRVQTAPLACAKPEETGPDPLYRTVVGTDSKVYGIDLDGQDSREDGTPKGATCPHGDFVGINGERGIDNQFYRAVGCTPGFQSSGGKLVFETEMLAGSWGILISLRGVHSLVNQKDIEVDIYANADPIQLSSARNALGYATYNPDQDPRFRARTHGSIVDGVLITDPVNLRFHSVTNTAFFERPIDAARLRMKIMPDGSLDGIMAGYTKVDELYDFVVGYRNPRTKDGKPLGRDPGSGGSAASAGMTCNGIYHAMKANADGERDPKTGKCDAISNQYRLTAVPAFVVEKTATVATKGQ